MNNTLTYSKNIRSSPPFAALRLGYPISQRLLSLPRFSYFISLKFWLILSIVLIMSLLAFYIFQITAVISGGYQVQNYQKKISKLSEENKMLEINSTKINSLENIENKIQGLGFERINKTHYIQILENSMVTTK